MPRNVAQSTKSCAARISTEPSITPCGGIAIPTAAKMIAAENDAIHIYFFIGIVFFSGCDYVIVIAENPSPQLMLDFYMVAPSLLLIFVHQTVHLVKISLSLKSLLS